eukprot:6212335-Pleurochrysis_carterae.AAC.4
MTRSPARRPPLRHCTLILRTTSSSTVKHDASCRVPFVHVTMSLLVPIIRSLRQGTSLLLPSWWSAVTCVA